MSLPNSKDLSQFLEIIYKSFKLLKFDDDVFYHYWYGDKAKVLQLFSGMSFPALPTLSKMGRLSNKLFVLNASHIGKNEIYGAAILKANSSKKLELVSFVVNPEHRKHGHGYKLLMKLAEMARSLKVESISLRYRTYWKSNEIWEKLLERAGWAEPELKLWYVSMPDANTQYHKEWYQQAKIIAPFHVEEWSTSSFQQLRNIMQTKDWKNIVPKALDPFQMSELVLPHASLILKKDEQIAGWLICHLLQPDTVQATTLFVHPRHGKGQGLILIAEALRRRKLGVRVIYMIEKDNRVMYHLTQKYLGGDKVDMHELRSRVIKI